MMILFKVHNLRLYNRYIVIVISADVITTIYHICAIIEFCIQLHTRNKPYSIKSKFIIIMYEILPPVVENLFSLFFRRVPTAFGIRRLVDRNARIIIICLRTLSCLFCSRNSILLYQ